MKKLLIIPFSLLLFSCHVQKPATVIPKAINTVSTASFSDLNLERSDYEILDAITAEASIVYRENRKKTRITIHGVDDNFELAYKYKGIWICESTGVLKYGYLSNDYVGQNTSNYFPPEEVARRLAIYRAVNEVRLQGGDGLIEPTISTNIEQRGRDIIYKSTVIAKSIKIKRDKEL